MKIAVAKETLPRERRVAVVPDQVSKYPSGHDIVVESGAGAGSGHADAAYVEKGAKVQAGALQGADLVLKVRTPTTAEIGQLREGATLVGLMAPLSEPQAMKALAARGVTTFALELLPRISRAQSMDALSAMATIAGYKSVLLAAEHLPKFMPLLMTAAGMLKPARVLVIGAGVAGLQAIATARRLGAVVEAYDTRPVVKEQVESLGATFVELPLETKDAQDSGGYAKAQSEEFYRKQRELMGKVIAANDIVITTALVPGQKAPILVTEDMVRGMRAGSVIVDLAAEAGGNVALTEPGRVVERHGVTLVGPVDLASSMAVHASDMYARNVTTFANHLLAQGGNGPDLSDEITRGSLVTHRGEVVHEAVKAALARSSN
jgi:proton-translocating NAD(P)+ transhydrogenase subunit alpha